MFRLRDEMVSKVLMYQRHVLWECVTGRHLCDENKFALTKTHLQVMTDIYHYCWATSLNRALSHFDLTVLNLVLNCLEIHQVSKQIWNQYISKISFDFECHEHKAYLKPTDDLRGVYPRPMLLSLSLSESGVDADKEDRDGRDIAIDLDERSRTCIFDICKNGISRKKRKREILIIKCNWNLWILMLKTCWQRFCVEISMEIHSLIYLQLFSLQLFTKWLKHNFVLKIIKK